MDADILQLSGNTNLPSHGVHQRHAQHQFMQSSHRDTADLLLRVLHVLVDFDGSGVQLHHLTPFRGQLVHDLMFEAPDHQPRLEQQLQFRHVRGPVVVPRKRIL